jgi:predicted GTPase
MNGYKLNTIDLRSLTTTTNANADINVGKTLLAEDKDGLEDLQAEDLGLDKLKRDTVNTDHTLSGLAVSDGSSRFLQMSI